MEDVIRRIEAALGPERSAKLRENLERLRPHYERAKAFARELPPRDWAGIAVACLAFLFVLQFSRLLSRQTRLLERQTDLMESQAAAADQDRELARQVARARLRGALWRIDDVLQPGALRDVAALPDRRGAAVREARQVLEEEQLNPALLEDSDSSTAWQSALAAARLAEETASNASADANFFLMQAERVRDDVMTVRQRLAPETVPPSAPSIPVQAPTPQQPSGPPPESSPLPRPAPGMQR